MWSTQLFLAKLRQYTNKNKRKCVRGLFLLIMGLKKEEEVDLTDYTSGGVVVANYIFNY